MIDLVFNIENLFSNDKVNGCLGQADVKGFYIEPYQRGYKWKSENRNSLVSLFMTDLLDNFETNRVYSSKGEYYLQYITVKQNKQLAQFEVIDGQQRLTTLILLFSIMSLNDKCINITTDKLTYAIRESVSEFLNKHVYSRENLKVLLNCEWDDTQGLVIKDDIYNEQDIYYIFKAIKKINEMLPAEEVFLFYNYVKEKIKIIVNTIEPHVDSEKVFRNLNSNKVELTNTELIKGLLLTKQARDRENPRFKELLEIRTSLGRQWDEISRWINNIEIKSYFFPSHYSYDAMQSIIELVAFKNHYPLLTITKGDYKYDLFNFYQAKIKKGEKTANDFFKDLKLISSVFKDWYDNNYIYNLFGYLFFAKGTKFKTTDVILYLEMDKVALLKSLRNEVNELLDFDLADMEYGNNNDEIHRILLALNVFSTNSENNRFNFYLLQSEKWSLEHIFPQNPSEISDVIGKKDILMINSLKEDKQIDLNKFVTSEVSLEDVQYIYKQLEDKLNIDKYIKPITINENEKNIIYYLIRTDRLNTIGNMALLTSSDNSSNSNGMFDFKRLKITKRISNGSFVPKHTYDVFSKLLSEYMISDLTVWTEQDITAHYDWIEKSILKLKEMN